MCVPYLLFNQLFNYLIHFTTVRRQSPSSNLHYGNNFSGQQWYEINPSILQDEANSRDSTTAKREIAFRTNPLITAQVRLRPKFKNGIFFGILNRKSGLQIPISHFFAEREGFEPPDPLRSTVFKTAAFDHSAISPKSNVISLHVTFSVKWTAKISTFFEIASGWEEKA